MRPTKVGDSLVGSGGGDPHQVLGVARDASEAEIRRAYRALAKRHHPDGGQGSVARFLAIQAAYEALAGGGRSRPDAGGGRAGTTAGSPASGPPRPGSDWARRPRPSSSARRDPGPAGSGRPRAGERTGAESSRARRPAGRRRATLGSTTYDEAEEVFEPGWGGASWYGPSSGTYWTLNPREYADPRKHGPEYQARARRMVEADGAPSRREDATGDPDHATGDREHATVRSDPAPAAAGAGRGVVARILARWRRGTIPP